MINRQLSRLLLCSILGSTTLISGCALVRKDSAPHQQLKPEQIKLADDIHLASSGWPQAQWWKQLNDPQLDALIQRTLSGSHTLAEAKLREEKAQSQADLLDAGSQLQVAALGMLNRQRVSANGFLSPYSMDAPALGMDGPYYTEATVGLFAGLDRSHASRKSRLCALICKFVSVCMRRLMPVKRCANAWRWSVNWTAKNAHY